MVCFRFTLANALQKGDKCNKDNRACSRLSTVHVFKGSALRQTAVTQPAPAGLQSNRTITTNLPATMVPLTL